MEDRNPSPPPEFEEDTEVYRPDSVGGTAISKHWVLTTLMDIINEVEKHNDSAEDSPVDVAESLQDSACKLWDVCVDKDVAVFLLDFDIVEILCGVILKSKAPRLTEIAVGILANMACSGTACQAISKHSALRSVILALLADPDTQSLVETVRLLRICIANPNTADPWVESAAENAKDLLENSIFILNSSTNGKLLANLAEVLDQMFKYSEKILETFCDKNFIVALLEALEQLSKESNSLHAVCHPLHALHTVAETEKGRLVVVEQRRNIATALATLTEQWMNFHPKVAYESSTTMSSSEVSISCCLATASTIFDSLDEDGDKLDDEDREMLIRFSKTVLAAKGVVTALAVLSSSAVTIPDEVEPPNEFKTPLVGHKNSPRVSTPLLTHTVKISGSITPSSTPKAVSEPDTPQHVENGTPVSSGSSTPSDGEQNESKVATNGSPRVVKLPSVTLCELAEELLQSASKSNIKDSKSPQKKVESVT